MSNRLYRNVHFTLLVHSHQMTQLQTKQTKKALSLPGSHHHCAPLLTKRRAKLCTRPVGSRKEPTGWSGATVQHHRSNITTLKLTSSQFIETPGCWKPAFQNCKQNGEGWFEAFVSIADRYSLPLVAHLSGQLFPGGPNTRRMALRRSVAIFQPVWPFCTQQEGSACWGSHHLFLVWPSRWCSTHWWSRETADTVQQIMQDTICISMLFVERSIKCVFSWKTSAGSVG